MKTCPHLEPLEHELAENSVALSEGQRSPYGPEWGLWSACDATFDEPSLRVRLQIPSFVTYEEYDGHAAGSDATFYCPQCKRAIMGLHPKYANRTTPRIK